MLQPRDLRGRTAISYTRWSSAQQTEGDSLRRQTEEAERFCATYGLTLDRQLVDPGVSAFKGANLEAELGRFVKAVAEGAIPQDTVLLVENLDRISRAEHDVAYDFFRGLLKTGVTVVTLHDQQVHTHEAYRKDVMNIVRSLIAMSEANKYSDRLSRRIRASWEGRATKAKSGKVKISKVPFWIDRETQDFNDRVEDARLIYRLAGEGLGQAAIVQRLNEAGIPSPSGKAWEKSGVQWTLASKAAYGSYTVRDEEIRDYFPAIVSEAEWLALRNRTRDRTHNPQASNTANLFPRLLRCHHCGSTMNLSTSKHKDKTFRYLSCSGKAFKRTDCTAPNWDYLQFEAFIIDRIGFLAVPHEQEGAATPDRSREEALEGEIVVLTARQENLISAAASAETATMIKLFSGKADEVTREIEAKRRELLQIRESAARHQTATGSFANFEEDTEIFQRLAVEDRAEARRLLGDLVERITLESEGADRAAHVTLRDGYSHTMVLN